MDKINLTNLFRTLSVASATATFYGLTQNKSLDEVLKQVEYERNINKLINEKYNKLLETKLTESELNNLISNEKMKSLMEEMNELKSKLSNKNLINESYVNNSDNTDSILDQLNDIKQTFNNSNNTLNSFLDVVEKYTNSKNSNNFINNFTDSFLILLNNINSIVDSMSMSQKLASGSFFILLSLFSILSIFYGDYLIIKLNLENRFPRFAKVIQLRRKFQHFYILLDITISSIILIIIMYINIRYLIITL
jgi:hypothetical protein